MEKLAHAQPPGFVRSGGYQLHLIYPNLLICSGFDLHQLVAGELILQFSITKNFPTLVLTKNEENHSNFISH